MRAIGKKIYCDAPSEPSHSIDELLRYYLKLGAASFGGPVAPVIYMRRYLVEQKSWISQKEY